AAEAGGIEPYLAALRETVDVFGRRGGAYVSTSTATPEETWDAVFELYGYSREFYENERDGG
ncbi:MAG: hypothetical protein LBT36_03780, partial [Oscillospiraceae bacterium]|nr:hypothetical protein [Oscillospiraceae bacterium]